MANYKLSNQVEEDLIRIHQWGVEQFGEQAADAYYFRFFERFEILAESPYLYPAADDIREGYRKSVCGVDTIYYRVVDTGVEIMAIIGQQDLEGLVGKSYTILIDTSSPTGDNSETKEPTSSKIDHQDDLDDDLPF